MCRKTMLRTIGFISNIYLGIEYNWFLFQIFIISNICRVWDREIKYFHIIHLKVLCLKIVSYKRIILYGYYYVYTNLMCKNIFLSLQKLPIYAYFWNTMYSTPGRIKNRFDCKHIKQNDSWMRIRFTFQFPKA